MLSPEAVSVDDWLERFLLNHYLSQVEIRLFVTTVKSLLYADDLNLEVMKLLKTTFSCAKCHCPPSEQSLMRFPLAALHFLLLNSFAPLAPSSEMGAFLAFKQPLSPIRQLVDKDIAMKQTFFFFFYHIAFATLKLY